MKSTDRFLFGIVIAVVLLMTISFAVALLRPRSEYLPDDRPEGVVHNYLLALQHEDHDRAYEYLSPRLKGYPKSSYDFSRNVKEARWSFRKDRSVSFKVLDIAINDMEALAEVSEIIFNREGLLIVNESASNFNVSLEYFDNKWWITHSDYYWHWCWEGECK